MDWLRQPPLYPSLHLFRHICCCISSHFASLSHTLSLSRSHLVSRCLQSSNRSRRSQTSLTNSIYPLVLASIARATRPVNGLGNILVAKMTLKQALPTRTGGYSGLTAEWPNQCNLAPLASHPRCLLSTFRARFIHVFLRFSAC